MKQRFIEVAPDAEQRQAMQFETWRAAQGVTFVDAQAEAAYGERVALIRDAIELRQVPERVPVCPSAGFFPIEYAGLRVLDAMYDYDALTRCWERYHLDLMPDAYSSPANIVPGRLLDILDLKLYQWPGHGVSRESEYQFVEAEYMKAAEYQDLIDDPSAFFLNVYWPRIFGALQPFAAFPLLPPMNEIPVIPPTFMRFGGEAMKNALKSLARAGEEALVWRSACAAINGRIMGRGFPAFSGGFTKAPFDVIGDSLRGTTGVMLDMFRHPDELKEACERLTPIMVKSGAASCRANGHIMPFIPLHKGADSFMSEAMFQTFYWPTLRKLIIGLINEGMVPQLFAEGSYNRRLEIISDLPKGKTLWWFDRTDMKRAKQALGRVACLAGNMPLDLLCTGTPEQVAAYCRSLIETAAHGGGFIFSSGAPIQGARTENVKAMMESARRYGNYRASGRKAAP
jgi:hypothetical protein